MLLGFGALGDGALGDVLPMLPVASDAGNFVEAVASVRYDALVPLEESSNTLRRDALVPIETGLSVRRDAIFPTEIMSTVRRDVLVTKEWVAKQNRDIAPINFEFLRGAIVFNRTVPIEINMGVRADKPIPTEAEGIIQTTDVAVSFESLSSAKADAVLPTEIASGVRRDINAEVEVVGGATAVSGDLLINLEVSSAVSSDKIITVEESSNVSRLNFFNDEIIGSVRRNTAVPIESVSKLITDRIYSDEILSDQSRDIIAPAEIVAKNVSDRAIQNENASSVLINRTSSAEIVLSVNRDVVDSVELSSRQVRDVPIQSENTLRVRGDIAVPVENLSSTVVIGDTRLPIEIVSGRRRDVAVQQEVLSKQAKDTAFPTEIESDVEGVNSGIAIPFEIVAGRRRDMASPLEAALSVVVDRKMPAETVCKVTVNSRQALEILLNQRADIAVPLENLGDFLVFSSTAIPLEFVASNVTSKTFNVEVVHSVLKDLTFPLELEFALVSTDVGFGLESISGVKTDILSLAEAVLSVVINRTVPVEFESDLMSFGSSGLLPLEFTLSVQTDEGVQVEIVKFAVLRRSRGQLYSTLVLGIDSINGM